jgi:isorenieratene synthase
VIVVGGGIAGLAAAAVLAERGARVTVLEAEPQLGGRVRAWPLPDGRTMSRGFHAFFRQYYNLRALLRRADPNLDRLLPITDYPLTRPDGITDSFTGLPLTPPWSIIGFVLASPTFTLTDLPKVDLPSALELVRVRFPGSYSDYDGESAAAFLDRLRFPTDARDLALEVFARSFFADPTEFSAGELVAMFHTYFLGSAEGLLFDVPDDDYDTALWAPLGRYLASLGVEVRTSTQVDALADLTADGVVLATDPRTARELIAHSSMDGAWAERVAATRNAPPFAVLRLWLDTPVASTRPAFVGTSGFGPLDNISVLDRFEAGAARWAASSGGSVVELHGYALYEATDIEQRLIDELHRAWPETATAGITARELLIRDDCALVDTAPWAERPGVHTPDPTLVLAGDWVRCDLPVALMERAATTGVLAANALLAQWGVAGEEVWSVPIKGLLG